LSSPAPIAIVTATTSAPCRSTVSSSVWVAPTSEKPTERHPAPASSANSTAATSLLTSFRICLPHSQYTVGYISPCPHSAPLAMRTSLIVHKKRRGSYRCRDSQVAERWLLVAAAGPSAMAAGFPAGADRVPTPTGRHGIGVVDAEATAHERVDIVDVRTVQVTQADRVDDDVHPLKRSGVIVLAGVRLEGHPILHP